MTTIFVPRELNQKEKRVAATPQVVKKYTQLGFTVLVETGAGGTAFCPDEDYTAAGATIVPDFASGAKDADMVLFVNPPSFATIDALKEGCSVISFVYPHQHPGILEKFNGRKVSAFAMEAIPRITRAQKLDALSSQNNIAGYQAVLMAAATSPRIFPLMTTAAGTLPAARVVVMGAGVAGLQAIATAKRLGAVVEVSDVRPAVKEQVQSLGAVYIEVPATENMETKGGYAKEASAEFLKRQEEVTRNHLKRADAIICSALVPGKQAPVLISAETVGMLKPGTVIVDMAAEQGGNCALTKPGEVFRVGNVTIIGTVNIPSEKSMHSSEMYAKNLLNIIQDQTDKEKRFAWNFSDEVVLSALLTHGGETRQAVSAVDVALSAKDKAA